MNDFQRKYAEYSEFFEAELTKFCDNMKYQPSILTESMKYSLLLGGKRIRPVLFFAALDLFEQDWKREVNFAIALECIHTYSLIHDDLPAMDNDDFRRGKPSNHKQFGEGQALLAGDALLNTAFSILLRESARGEKYLCASQCLCDASGADGMIAGQSADLLQSDGKGEINEKALQFIYEHKTAKLIAAPLTMASVISDRPSWDFTRFGSLLGALFQVTDDILDVKGEATKLGKSTGKDEAENKLTCVKIYGLAESELHADLLAEQCHLILEGIKGDVSFFHSFCDLVRFRQN